MTVNADNQTYLRHRYLDEAGDTTFFGKGRTPIIGVDQVCRCALFSA